MLCHVQLLYLHEWKASAKETFMMSLSVKKGTKKKKKEEIFAQSNLRHVTNSAHKPRGSV